MEQDHRLEGGQRGGVQLSDGGGVSTGKGAECAFFLLGCAACYVGS